MDCYVIYILHMYSCLVAMEVYVDGGCRLITSAKLDNDNLLI